MTPKEKFDLKRKNFIEKTPKEFSYLVTDFGFNDHIHIIKKQSNGTIIRDVFEYKKGKIVINIQNSYHPVDYGFEIKFIDFMLMESKLLGYVLKENQDLEQSYLHKQAFQLKETINKVANIT